MQRLLAGFVVTLATAVGACDGEGSGRDLSLTVEDIVSRPGGLAGEEVAVSAEVGAVFRPYAFSLKSGEGRSVLVVSLEHVLVAEGKVVRVIGAVLPVPLDRRLVPRDVAAFVEAVAGEDHEHVILASQVATLEKAGER